MNKLDLVAEVRARLGLSWRASTEAVDAVVESIKRAVVDGQTVTLPGFGSFEKRLRAPRTARNPQTGDTMKIPAVAVPVFRPGAGFKEAVAGPKRSKSRKRVTRTR